MSVAGRGEAPAKTPSQTPSKTAACFFYGTLAHPPLLATVLGRAAPSIPAVLPGYRAVWAKEHTFPMLVPDARADGAEGVLVQGLTDSDLARLSYYEAGLATEDHNVRVPATGEIVRVRVSLTPEGALAPGAPWRLSDWAARWGATVTAAAGDFLRGFGQSDPHEMLRRYHQMLIRGGARVRAGDPGPAAVRRQPLPGDVTEKAFRQPYAQYFAVEEYDLRFRRFDGTMSDVLTRAVFISGDASVVLPYDPVRDRVLVIEQWRAGPHARGDALSWLIEAVAGRVDGGETPEDAARREAMEEAGLTLGALIPVSHFYPSPASQQEYIYSFVGIADLPDGAAGIGGHPGEGEDIRSHVIPFARLMELVATGEVNNAPLVILALWLDKHRDAIRRDHGSGAAGA